MLISSTASMSVRVAIDIAHGLRSSSAVSLTQAFMENSNMDTAARETIRERAYLLYYRFEKASRTYFYLGQAYLSILAEDLARIQTHHIPTTLQRYEGSIQRCQMAFDVERVRSLLFGPSGDLNHNDLRRPAVRYLLDPANGQEGYEALVDTVAAENPGADVREILDRATFTCRILEYEVEQLRSDINVVTSLAHTARSQPRLGFDESSYGRMKPWIDIMDRFMASKCPRVRDDNELWQAVLPF